MRQFCCPDRWLFVRRVAVVFRKDNKCDIPNGISSLSEEKKK